jgi:TolB-like protein/Tfp pilus assembly protein PilF
MHGPPDALRDALRGRYDIGRRIGSGGMADVFLAEDCRHGRPVAVKVLRPEVADSVGAERFSREIETAARLQHPNILPVYDSGEADGTLFYVMPFVEGASLRERLRTNGRFPWEVALPLIREVGDALAFAHLRNVVHRDIKPENILFLADHAVVADFGIARAIVDAGADKLTLDGTGLGTPEYMSPEQAFGETGIDARSDVYSLACVVYEMLQGTPPFTAPSPFGVVLKKSKDPVPSLDVPPGAGIPGHVDEVLRKALDREPGNRYARVEDMVAALSGPPIVGVAPPAGAPSVAVLPFANLSGGTSDDYLSDGISEELIHGLSTVRAIRVVARTSSFAFRGRTGDIREIGRELKAQWVLEGSVRRSANRLRISARLVDAATGFEQWAERYEREFTDIFAVQDDIARAIVGALRGELVPGDAPIVTASTAIPAAYEHYLEGRFHWNRRTEASLRQAVHLLRRAVALDPSFAQARAALAEVLVTLAIYGADAPSQLMPEARELADRALHSQPESTDALGARACIRAVFDWDWAAAERDFLAAIALPQATPAPFRWYATSMLVPNGRFDEARAQLARALELDPLSPVLAMSVGVTFLFERRYAEASREFRALLSRDAQFGMAWFFLGQSLTQAEDHSNALAALEQAVALLGESNEALTAEAVGAARAGREAGARAALAELDRRAGDRYVSPVLAAQVHAALGETDAAVERLEAARALRATDLIWIGVRPVFDALRADARFARLLVDTGLGNSRFPERTS